MALRNSRDPTIFSFLFIGGEHPIFLFLFVANFFLFLTFFVHSSFFSFWQAPLDLKERALASPVHVSVTMPDTAENAALLAKAAEDLAARWLGAIP